MRVARGYLAKNYNTLPRVGEIGVDEVTVDRICDFEKECWVKLRAIKRLQIDVGFGDAVTPAPQEISLLSLMISVTRGQDFQACNTLMFIEAKGAIASSFVA